MRLGRVTRPRRRRPQTLASGDPAAISAPRALSVLGTEKEPGSELPFGSPAKREGGLEPGAEDLEPRHPREPSLLLT